MYVATVNTVQSRTLGRMKRLKSFREESLLKTQSNHHICLQSFPGVVPKL